MKRKTVFTVILCILLVAIAVCMIAATVKGALRYGFVEGRVLIADNGSYLIILDDYSPIRMSDQSRGGGLFSDLQTGDRIRILHDEIKLSYPGQTDVYSLRVLEKGSIDDIPSDVISALKRIGWIAES